MNIIDFLKENENTRKIFGVRELKIIEKQILGINLTQSEKNRLSRDIRKKLKFIREAAHFEQEFDLKKGLSVKEKINEVVETIKEDELFPKIKKILLFGSTATNERTFRSDIDIAVEFAEISEKQALKFRLRVLRYFNEKIDLQVYNVLPDKIKKSIDKNGRVLYGRD